VTSPVDIDEIIEHRQTPRGGEPAPGHDASIPSTHSDLTAPSTAVKRIQARQRPRPIVWAWRAVVLLLCAMFAKSVITDSGFDWPVVAHYFTAEAILAGVARTLLLTVVAMAIALVLGIILAVMRLSSDRVASSISAIYTTAFRGTPLLVQLFFWYNIAALYPRLSVGVPFGPAFVSGNANNIVTPLLAAVVAIGLNESAYMSEIIRAGILSVEKGQLEAALALSMNRRLTYRRVILPQAIRLVLPPIGNETVGMLKNTSVVVVIGMSDLLYSAETIYTRTYQVIALLIVASIWYFILTTVLTVAQAWLEVKVRPSGASRSGSSSWRAGLWPRVRKQIRQDLGRRRNVGVLE
jgi:polar amino acid transport system permease protein